MKLKIAYIVPSFPATTETFVVNQISDMIDRGHDVSIYAFKKNQDAVIHQKVIDYDLMKKTFFYQEPDISLGKRYSSFISFLLKNFRNVNFNRLLKNYTISNFRQALKLRFYYKYFWILKKNKDPHIIHVHFGDKAKFVANIKNDGFFFRSKFIVTFHGYDLDPSNLSKLEKEYITVFKVADLLTVNSPYSKSLLDKITSYNRIKILPVGLDTHKFKMTSNGNSGKFNILFIGRLIDFKGPQLAIDIIEILRNRGYLDIKIIVIGEGHKRGELEKKITEKDLHEYVCLKGALSQEEIVSEFQNADVFLLPGIYDESGRAETQGLVVQEAQAMKLPVIVSDAGGTKYGIVEGETGFVVKEKDCSAFADKIEYLINNEEIRLRMGENGRAFVIQNYDSKKLGKKLEKYYYDILEE